MSRLVTVTGKIPVELKERLRKLGVNVSEVIRRSLELEAERLERERLKSMTEETGEILSKIPDEELVKTIRLSRENR
ncbi:hypothetical protein KEJ27_08690 [Candidatus Bathyarchaeota archaeon]|nr:hypothetical protein [Candidatus Bathyarchaeota archaeon]MBS7612966.1 hypothetical protein [Candidatus Bathyarchaeota archaeon]MBS7617776.1 hypothetical protein [Candidatus Bathyarchaeota archaeon]